MKKIRSILLFFGVKKVKCCEKSEACGLFRIFTNKNKNNSHS